MRERAAAFAPVEAVRSKTAISCSSSCLARPKVEASGAGHSVLCHIGAKRPLESFNENLRGANVATTRLRRAISRRLSGCQLAARKCHYSVDVTGIKTRKLPDLNDDFAKDVSDAHDSG